MRCMSLLKIESKKFPVSSSTQGALEFGGGVEPLLKISRRHLTRKEPIKNLPTRLRIHHSPHPAYVCLTLRVTRDGRASPARATMPARRRARRRVHAVVRRHVTWPAREYSRSCHTAFEALRVHRAGPRTSPAVGSLGNGELGSQPEQGAPVRPRPTLRHSVHPCNTPSEPPSLPAPRLPSPRETYRT